MEISLPAVIFLQKSDIKNSKVSCFAVFVPNWSIVPIVLGELSPVCFKGGRKSALAVKFACLALGADRHGSFSISGSGAKAEGGGVRQGAGERVCGPQRRADYAVRDTAAVNRRILTRDNFSSHEQFQ